MRLIGESLWAWWAIDCSFNWLSISLAVYLKSHLKRIIETFLSDEPDQIVGVNSRRGTIQVLNNSKKTAYPGFWADRFRVWPTL